LRIIGQWTHTLGYSLIVLERPAFVYPSTASVAAETVKSAFGAPTLVEWATMWSTFDAITLNMVSTDLLHTKPIDLRHICLFYVRPLLAVDHSRLRAMPRSAISQRKSCRDCPS
jgi:hypothetical protein